MAGFDPNQPRDDIGRWTETGAGGNGISGRDRQLLGLAPAPAARASAPGPSPAARASAPGPAARASAPGPAARASAPASGSSQMTNRDRQLLGLAPGPSRPGGSAAPAPQPLGLAPNATPQTAQNTRQTPANLLKISSPAQASPGTLATQSNSVNVPKRKPQASLPEKGVTLATQSNSVGAGSAQASIKTQKKHSPARGALEGGITGDALGGTIGCAIGKASKKPYGCRVGKAVGRRIGRAVGSLLGATGVIDFPKSKETNSKPLSEQAGDAYEQWEKEQKKQHESP